MAVNPPAATKTLGPRQIWTELELAGASAVQAAGIMGNWLAESRLNPEAQAVDSNGYKSYGLAQWNTAPGNYPNAASLVTGDPARDARAQVQFFYQTGGGAAAKGSTPQQVASNIAANYERCAGCQSGGAQNTARQANAATVAGWAGTGNWPAATAQASDTAALSSAAQAQSSSRCLWQIGGGSLDLLVYHQSLPSVCVFSKTQGRAAGAVGVMVAGAIVGGLGLALLMLGSDTGKTVAKGALSVIPAGRVAVAAGAAADSKTGGPSVADRQEREQIAQEAHTRNQYRKQRRARENLDRDEARERELADVPPF